MQQHKNTHFYALGLSYRKADAEIRGMFSLCESSKKQLLKDAIASGVESLVVVSTCNRTELYGFAEHPYQLIKLLCANSKGDVETFEKFAYIYKEREAIAHMFKVGSGLDSQILGDFEIISQLKSGARLSKSAGLLNAFTERLVNSVIQASKRIKTETELSSGATSVSFASVQFIINNVNNISEKNILLFGTGKIGRNTCENLVKHTKNSHITIINRTKRKAEEIAGKFNVVVKDYSQLTHEVSQADILIVATGAQRPTIDKSLLTPHKPLLILDLSIPKNVHQNVADLKHIQLIHLDDLAKITDETLERRKAFIPIAQGIIEEIQSEFLSWLEARKLAPTLQAIKHKLLDLKNTELDNQRKKFTDFNEAQAELISNNLIQKITNHFAHHLKADLDASDESIELIKKIFQIENTQNA
ncbi:glutamyl-tRNA reductase [Paucihalobacter ruber]|uniref:Glutamyl-tRNA reductase n=1 Tax=Paucihalobacter ruber TaxID=2567861 RepID=A0A506PN81_9FLAO|nr:glutamyl-tRNA reductase [Paucihalobacter ruber]TPV35019.1 glutamyl-tRNA reductase [Paucihalobacter ruber]